MINIPRYSSERRQGMNMQTKNAGKAQYADIVIGVLLLIFCIFIFVETEKMPVISKNTLGSAFFPRLLAGILAGLSVLQIIIGFLNRSGERYFYLEKEKRKNLFDLLIVAAFIILYGLMWNKVPFLITSPLLVAVLCFVFRMKIRTSVILMVVLPIFLFLIFKNGLHVMLM